MTAGRDLEHEPGCALDPVHWLRHALGAAQRLVSAEPDVEVASIDKTSAAELLNVLERYAEFDDSWRNVTLYEVARGATLMGGTFAALCTCRRRGGSATDVRL